jgi:deoxycytidylate deaminase
MKEDIDKRVRVIKEGEIGSGKPSWDEYLMFLALGASTRASCHHVRGGVIVADESMRIRGTGYNGASSMSVDSCLDIGCAKEAKGAEYRGSLNTGQCVGIHAEMNALGHLVHLEGKPISLYSSIFPCPSCAKNTGPYNVERVVFRSVYDGEEMTKAMDIFERHGTNVYRLNLSPERYMDIIFNLPAVDFDIWDPNERKRISGFLKAMKK